jgi:hypothetical protein
VTSDAYDQMTPEERETADYVKYLMDLEKAGERTSISLGPFSAFTLIGLLQLSTRHPDLPPNIRKTAQEVYRQLYPLFRGTRGEEVLYKGEHPEWDV